VIPLSDGMPARRFPVVNATLIAACFAYQLVDGNFGLFSAGANGGGVAFFAHIGGFLFGVLIARLVAGAAVRQPATATT
jgi:membrane associated rhomboid family serine protease